MIWKASTLYLGLLASSTGEIKTVWGKELPQRTNDKGYRTVFWEGKTYLVHRVICDAFHGPPDQRKRIVLHREGRTDNRPENVYWATAQDRSDRRGRSVERLEDGRIWRSCWEAARELGLSQTRISAAARGEIDGGWAYI